MSPTPWRVDLGANYQSPPLLVPRKEAARLLGCSTALLIRLENRGLLQAIKLNRESRSACTFYKRDDIVLLASGR
jgi:hypothetical protein